jgi:hypothetical protein
LIPKIKRGEDPFDDASFSTEVPAAELSAGSAEDKTAAMYHARAYITMAFIPMYIKPVQIAAPCFCKSTKKKQAVSNSPAVPPVTKV